MSPSRPNKLIAALQHNEGLWFPLLTATIDRVYRMVSVGRWLNVSLEARGLGGWWVSEAYQLLWVVIGAVWLATIRVPLLTSAFWIPLGAIIALYRPTEIAVFSTHWLLVERGPVKDYRRSLACFLLNLFEVGVLGSVVYMLLGSFGSASSPWHVFQLSLAATFTLGTPEHLSPLGTSYAVAVFLRLVAWVVAAPILANIVGRISRSELASAS
jgi:hypothetical protein